MNELKKLELYLALAHVKYERIDTNSILFDQHQIIVYDDNGRKMWDAICQRGSYGYEKGLLEIYGDIVDYETDGDTVVGYLTADEVIRRHEKKHCKPEEKKTWYEVAQCK